MDYCPNGDVRRLSADDLESVLELSADDSKRFLTVMMDANFIDADQKIHDWNIYAGRYIRDSKFKRHPDKLKEFSKLYNTKRPPTVRRPSADRPQFVGGTLPNQPNQPNPTEPDLIKTPLPPFEKGGVDEGKKPISQKPVFELPDWITKTDWDDFVEMRRKIRKPLTDRAKREIVKDLVRLKAQGFDVAIVLEQSIKNSWQGVFEIKADFQKKGGGNYKTAGNLEAVKKFNARMADEKN